MTTVQAIEYLKQEELGNKAILQQKIRVVETAVNEAEFLREVERIRSSGGWRVEEDRISLGGIELSLQEKIELDKQARELIAAKKELLEKKRKEEQEKIAAEKKEQQDKLNLQEILKTDFALVHKMRLWNGYGEICPWAWNPDESTRHLSVKQALEAYKEIQEFRITCIPRIEGAIQRAMEDLWADTTDERIFQREEIQNTRGGGWSQPDIRSYLGTSHKTFRDEDYWQTCILEESSAPIFNKEFQKWDKYCKKFLEINKGKPKLYEVIQKNEELEKKINILTNRNEILEEKLISIRSFVNDIRSFVNN